MYGRQPSVAGPNLIATLGFQMVQELQDKRRIQVFQSLLAGWPAVLLGKKIQQQAHRVAVAGQGCLAQAALGPQPLLEEILDELGQRIGQRFRHRTALLSAMPADWAGER